VLAALVAVVPPVGAAPPGAPVSTVPPGITGQVQVGRLLTAVPGTWSPSADVYKYSWQRDGVTVSAEAWSAPTYRVVPADLGHRLTVTVVAHNTAGDSDPVASAPSAVVAAGRFTVTARPAVAGVRRWDHTLTARPGSWSPAPVATRYQWFRGSTPIPRAVRPTYRLRVADFGHRINLRVVAVRGGYASGVAWSGATAPIGHRVGVRKRFTYSIATRGRITADLAVFARQVAETYADPRGWRSAGYRFTRVARGGDLTVVLAEASRVPSFGWPCSATWSCRSGRFVIINQTRWLHASPAWNRARLPLRDYRHMVVDHETGHWLGHRHSSCPGKGRLAPVMMQQSKGLDGCRFNPFPLPRERWTSR
jgi:hypothetical protein